MSLFDLSFRPLPLLGNPHVQTVLGNILAADEPTFPSGAFLVALPDGDRVVLHDTVPRGWHAGAPIAVLVHGLGGCHRSSYMQRVAQRLAARGVRVCRMDLRGAGAGIAYARLFYTAACSGDLHAVVEHLRDRHPASPVVLVGFSLGGNIVLKLAGEAGDRPLPNLCAVGAIAAPIDIVRCSEMMEQQAFYNAFYVRHLTTQVTRHQRLFPDLPRVRFPRGLTLRGFDDLYTAPRWGYADAVDYYRQASSLPLLGNVRVPALLLTARDDPFIAVEPFEALQGSAHIDVHIAPRGGHLGFLGLDGRGGIRWAESKLIDWLLGRLSLVASAPAAGDNAGR